MIKHSIVVDGANRIVFIAAAFNHPIITEKDHELFASWIHQVCSL